MYTIYRQNSSYKGICYYISDIIGMMFEKQQRERKSEKDKARDRELQKSMCSAHGKIWVFLCCVLITKAINLESQ